MAILTGSYGILLRTLRRAAPLLSRGDSKLAVGLRGRRQAVEVLGAWADTHRDRARPLVWIHAPSVGETLQARSVLDALADFEPALQTVFTFFSPSAVDLAGRLPVDVAGYLPWDVPSDMEDLVGRIEPSLVVFTRTEVWPGLTRAAVSAGAPVALCAASLPEGAGRLGPLARRALRPAFSSLSRVLAVSDDDLARFAELGVSDGAMEVTGDPAVDSAARRIGAADPTAAHLAAFADETVPILVAGSTWPADERALVGALAELGRRGRSVRAVIAPHEPTDAHVAKLEAALADAGIPTRTLTRVEREGKGEAGEAVIVDRVGVLAELYTIASVAFVGGGFHDDGLHSVIEPAAAGVPVLFGPRHEAQAAAAELVGAGAAATVDGVERLVRAIERWLDDEEDRSSAGARAAAWVDANRGAAERTARALVPLLARRQL